MAAPEIRFRLALDPGNVSPAAVGAADAIKKIGEASQISAKQTAAAMRNLPAQFTDIATSLAGGQSPLMVLMQQGGQIKDMFGGSVGTALKSVGGYVLGLVNPFTLAAAGAAALALAYKQGSAEGDAYAKSLILTGNAAGKTVGQLQASARSISATVGTTGAAADALAQLAGASDISPAGFERFAMAALKMEKAAGIPIADTVKSLSELGKAPLEAAIKLNESQNFLTTSVYRQIKALTEQGKTTAAAALAQETWAAAQNTRADQLTARLGLIERAWAGVTGAAKSAWDAMLNIGREDTLQERLARAQTELANRQARGPLNTTTGKAFEKGNAALQAQIVLLQQQIAAEDLAAKTAADQAAKTKKVIEADKKDKTDPKKELDAYRNLVSDLAGEQSGLASNFNEQAAVLAKGWKLRGDAVAVYDKAYAELLAKQPFAVKAAKEEADAHKAWADARAKAGQELAALYDSEVKAAQQSAKSVADQVQALQDENDAIALQTFLNTSLASAVEEVRISRLLEARAAALLSNDQEKVDAINAEIKARRELAKLTDKKQARTDAAAAGKRVDEYLSKDIGVDLSAGFNAASQSLGTFVQTFEKLIAAQDQYNAARRDALLAGRGIAEVDARHAAEQLNSYAALAGAAKGFFGQQTAGYKLLTGAEKAYRAIELSLAIKNAVQKILLTEAGTAVTVGGQAIEAGAVAAGQATQTAAVVAGEAGRNAAKVPGVFMAFMSSLGPWGIAAAAAAIAMLGVSVSGGIRTGGVTRTNDGTGSVLGDPTAKSESIGKSLDALKSVNTSTMRYSAQMLASLRSIDKAISGVSALLVQGGGITASLAGVQIGATQNAIGRLISKDHELTGKLVGNIPVIGGALQGLIGRSGQRLGNLFGSNTSVMAQGIGGDPQSLGKIMASGFAAQFFADVQTKNKFFGLTTSVDTSTQMSAADAETQRQFTMILTGLADTVSAASGPLGLAVGEVKTKLNNYIVDLGRVDLKGLTGQEISDKLSAVFSKAGDDIAKGALPGIEAWQQVGEGYLQTVTRVATSVDLVRTTLDALGQSTAAVSGLMVDRATAAMGLIEAFGGQDNFLSSTSAYLDAYYTEAERAALTTRQLSTVMTSLGMTLPKTKDAFRALVEAQDLSTEAGRNTYATLLGLSDAFAQLTDAAASATSSVIDEIKRLRGISADASTDGSAAALMARFGIVTAQARAGDQAALESLPDISKALESAAAATATSAADSARLRAWLAGSLTDTLKSLGLTVPGFARGGDFAGGWRVVGERGPELEATGPARIFSAQQTQAMLGGMGAGSGFDALVDELRAVRGELSTMRGQIASLQSDSAQMGAQLASYARQTASNTGKQFDLVDSVINGDNTVRTQVIV